MTLYYPEVGNQYVTFSTVSRSYTGSGRMNEQWTFRDNRQDIEFVPLGPVELFIEPDFMDEGIYLGTADIFGREVPVFEFGNRVYVMEAFFSPQQRPTIESLNIQEVATPCFSSGTAIATPQGDCAVEALCIGDRIQSAEGRAVPVRWIGRKTVRTVFRPAGALGLVRIGAGTLGNGLPRRDLTVTTDHGMLIDGCLVNAGALVGRRGIRALTHADTGPEYTVYHIETEGHEIIFAEGAPTETFVDYATRRRFENYAEFEALYGDNAPIAELDLPRISAHRVAQRTRCA